MLAHVCARCRLAARDYGVAADEAVEWERQVIDNFL
jgi:hypothetical protein